MDTLEFKSLLYSEKFTVYDGFEPSGNMHIGQGLLKIINVYNMLDYPNCEYIILLADIFADLNMKCDGITSIIKENGEKMIAIWKKFGLDNDRVKYLWSSKEIEKDPIKYFGIVLDISKKFNISRINRCTTIMGRSDADTLKVSQIFYPVMQCADIFYLKVDVCQMGMDQRKLNMLAKEYAEKMHLPKPIVLCQPMVPSLSGKGKMSKSDPNSSIFMTDTPEEVEKKIKKAFCEEGNIDNNPILEYFKHILYPFLEQVQKRDHLKKMYDYPSLESLYISIGKNVRIYPINSDYIDILYDKFSQSILTPQDLKTSASHIISTILSPLCL